MRSSAGSAMVRTTAVTTVAIAVLAVTGCTAPADDGKIVITLAGPNQWNTQSDSFGQEWEDLIERFEEEEPGIEVKTTVLPIASFADTLSTQLAAGTAPELIFNQPAPSSPDLVVPLDDYLDEPNPYDPEAATWLEAFNSNAFGDLQRDSAGHFEWVPFNLVTAGLFYNKEAFDEAGVTAPIESIGDLLDACSDLKSAGYTPLAMDNGALGTGWTAGTMLANLLSNYADELNVFDVDGNEGTASTVTQKARVRAVLTGELDATETPEVRAALELMKEVFDSCATPNWSGVAASATFVGGEEFLGGKAAMAWGTNFAISNLDDVDWEWASMPFPSITEEDSDLSSGAPARFGAVAGGTSYMIPATTTGDKLDAAIKFLQFASSPQGNGDWVAATNAIPATSDVSTVSEGTAGLVSGDWAKPRTLDFGENAPKADSGTSLFEGYLLGTKTIDEELTFLQEKWVGWAEEAVQDGGYTEDWATKN